MIFTQTTDGEKEGLELIGKSMEVEDEEFKKVKLPCWVQVLKN